MPILNKLAKIPNLFPTPLGTLKHTQTATLSCADIGMHKYTAHRCRQYKQAQTCTKKTQSYAHAPAHSHLFQSVSSNSILYINLNTKSHDLFLSPLPIALL